MLLDRIFHYTIYLTSLLFWLVIVVILFSGEVYGSGKFLSKVQPIPFELDDSLTQVRDKIAENGYNFRVADNWVVRLPAQLRQQMRTYHFAESPVTGVEVLSQNLDMGPLLYCLGPPLPDHFDLRNVAPGRSYIGPIRQQGSCGDCYAFGACAAAEGTYNLATGRYNRDCVDFSEACLAFCLDSFYEGFEGCVGSDYDYRELDAMIEKGVCFERQMPYDPFETSCSSSPRRAYKMFSSWHRIPCSDITAIKTAIRYFGVVDVAVLTNPAFDAYAGGIYEDSMTDCVGEDEYADTCCYAPTDHVVALVGWDDNGGDGYWILRNSWGSKWGEAGYMRIKYHSAHVACAACYLVYNENNIYARRGRGVVPVLQLLLAD